MNKTQLRELDKEIATKIFKFAVVAKDNDFYIVRRNGFALKPVPLYSSRLDDAHMVLIAMRENGFSYNVGSKIQNNSLIWVASFHPEGSEPSFLESHSLSSAICLAALEAKRKKNNRFVKMLTSMDSNANSNANIVCIEDYRKK